MKSNNQKVMAELERIASDLDRLAVAVGKINAFYLVQDLEQAYESVSEAHNKISLEIDKNLH